MATTGAMLGAAAGITSGDPSKAFQYTTAGATAGNAFAKGVNNRIPNSFRKLSDSVNREKQAIQKDYYGADYSQHMREVQDKKFRRDKEIREMYRTQLELRTNEQVDAAMRDAIEYRQYGVNDNDIIIKAMKADNGTPQNRASKTRIAAAKLAEASKTEKDLQTNMQRFAKTPGIKERQVQDMERMVRGINNL